jgi:L-fucose isomerase-like protein
LAAWIIQSRETGEHIHKEDSFMAKPTTFGVIIGNRGFFPDILARDGREEILRVLEKEGYGSVCLTPQDTKFGSVETL